MLNEIVSFMNQFQAGSVILFLAGIFFIVEKGISLYKKIRNHITDQVLTEEKTSTEKSALRSKIDATGSELDALNKEVDSHFHHISKDFTNHLEEADAQYAKLLKLIEELTEAVNVQGPKNEAFEERLQTIEKQIGILFESDKNYIIAYIGDIYQRYAKEKKCIDLLTLQNVEKVYERFLAETGSEDRFISKLMAEIRQLPTTKEIPAEVLESNENK